MSCDRVVALGDSVTFGVGDIGKNFIGPGWGARVAHQLDAVKFLNLSNLGARIRQLSEGQLPAAIAYRPTISIISIGGNDILRSRFNPAEVEYHLEKVVISLKIIGSEVVLLKIPDPKKTAPGPRMLREALSERRYALSELINRVGAATNTPIIQVPDEEAKARREIWHIDRMHPSAQGHQLLADKTLSALGRSAARESIATTQYIGRMEAAKWFAAAATMWFVKRSLDLIPTLLWLGIRYRVRQVFKQQLSKRNSLGYLSPRKNSEDMSLEKRKAA